MLISISMACPRTLINTVYAHWWIIQSCTSNRCQRIQNDFPWIIYHFRKSNRFVEQVIGNTDVDQGLSAGNKAWSCFLLCVQHQRCAVWEARAWCRFALLLTSRDLACFPCCLWMLQHEWDCAEIQWMDVALQAPIRHNGFMQAPGRGHSLVGKGLLKLEI